MARTGISSTKTWPRWKISPALTCWWVNHESPDLNRLGNQEAMKFACLNSPEKGAVAMRSYLYALLASLLLRAGTGAYADALTTAFTYQGSLSSAGFPANGSFDFQVALYSVGTGGSPLA